MPPKSSAAQRDKSRGKTPLSDDSFAAPPSPVLVRPCTPNDLQIVATVRTLQNLVNVEHKWKVRVAEAQRLNESTIAKIRRMRETVDHCQQGIRQLDAEVEALVRSALPVMVPVVAAPPKSPSTQAKKPSVAMAAPLTDTELHLTGPHLERRKAELAHVAAIVRAFYLLPRQSKEGTSQRPQSRQDMQGEIDEALRLATPVAELAAQAQAKAVSGGGANAAKHRAKTKVDTNLPDESMIGELSPADFLPLPCPRGVDVRLLNKVLTLRSRRLRLEASIAHFQSGIVPLERRLAGVHEMVALGGYSLSAVQPQIKTSISEEAALQKIRLAEDEAFAKRITSPASPSTSPPPRR